MSYLVLARKYRPQTFEDIVGQQHVTRTLSAAITQDRVAHAYLFTGTRGVGKTTIARILAKALNCESSDGPTPTPCNACRACTEITRGNFVDVIEIDGASNNSVDDVRQLRESVKYRPQSARKKIIIIDEVHMLSIAAFNALLKTLEEPPDHVVFIFATTEVHKVPDTILSRVQQYDFKSIPLALIFDALADIAKKESLSLSEDALRLVSRKAEGSMRDALSLLDQIIALGGDLSASELAEVLGLVDRQLLLRLSAAVLSEDTEAALAVLRDMGPVAWDVRAFYGDLMEHFRNLVIAKLAKDPAPLINATAEELAQISGQAAGAGIETLENLFGILIEAEEEVMRSSQQRLVLEMTILRLLAAGRVQSLDSLAQAVGRLRRELAGGAPARGSSGGGPAGGGYRSTPAASRPASAPVRRASEVSPASNGHAAAAAPEAAAIADDDLPPDLPADPQARFLAFVRAKDLGLWAHAGHGEVTVDGDLVRIAAPKGMHFDALTEEKGALGEAARAAFGDDARVEIAIGERRQDDRRKAENERREEEAAVRRRVLDDPGVTLLQQTFPEATITVVPEKR